MFIHLFQPPGAASFDACVHQPRAFPPSTSRASFRVNDTGEEGEESRNRNTVEKEGWTRTKVLDGRGDSPWNANSFRDNGHWAGGTSFANSRGAASRPRLSLSPFRINPIRMEGKGERIDEFARQVYSCNLFDDFVNRDLVGILISSWLVERCFEG